MEVSESTILTITQLNNQAKYILEKKFTHVWIEGEISTSKKYPSGHIYFTLKDDNSEISCVMFAQYVKKVSFDFSPGTKVIANGDVSLYLARGQYQFIAQNMYPSGQGELWLAFEKLKEKLQNEGLFDNQHKKNIPKYPKEIGVVTSSSGAVLRDIINVVNRRSPQVHILLRSAQVQGEGSSLDIASGIKDLNDHGRVDIIIVGRGGGSWEDLWSFNDEVVARAIFESKIPVISAVGHETDFTIADFVADMRAPTPSAAAEIAVPRRDELLQSIDHCTSRIIDSLKRSIGNRLDLVNQYAKRYGFHKPNILLEQISDNIEVKSSQLEKLIATKFSTSEQDIATLEKNLENLNPLRVLDRGYAIVYNEDGKIINSPKFVSIDNKIDVKLAKGRITAKVLKTRVNEND